MRRTQTGFANQQGVGKCVAQWRCIGAADGEARQVTRVDADELRAGVAGGLPVVTGFVAFRVFDVWKPGPVRSADEIPGGLGVMLDDARNEAGDEVISAAGSRVRVLRIATNEEAMIAQHCRDLLERQGAMPA